MGQRRHWTPVRLPHRPGRRGLGVWLALCVAWVAMASLPALAACGGQVRLTQPVEFSAQELAGFRAMAPLRVLPLDAPPMARHDTQDGYSGIGVDVWCFITRELGLRHDLLPGQNLSLADKLQQVQDGRADVFMPLSHQADRARLGLFTLPYYESYYAVIARKGRPLPVHGLADLADLQGTDHPRAEPQRQRQGGQHAEDTAQGQVLKDREALVELLQVLRQQQQHD